MNEIIKLFIEQPERTEKFILTILKLVLTYLICLNFLPHMVQLPEAIDAEKWHELGATQLVMLVIYFFIARFALWFLMCNFIQDFIVFRLFKLIPPKANLGILMLSLGMVHGDFKSGINHGIIELEEILEQIKKTGQSYLHDERYEVYSKIFLVATIWGISCEFIHLPTWVWAVWCAVGLFLVFINGYFSNLSNQLNNIKFDIYLNVRKQAYIEKVRRTLLGLSTYNHLFEIENKTDKIQLKKKEHALFPDSIVIHPIFGVGFHEDESKVIDSLKARNTINNNTNQGNMRLLIVSNLELKIEEKTMKDLGLSIIIAESIDDIQNRLRTYLMLTRDEFRAKSTP
jgi:hypothetical protein